MLLTFRYPSAVLLGMSSELIPRRAPRDTSLLTLLRSRCLVHASAPVRESFDAVVFAIPAPDALAVLGQRGGSYSSTRVEAAYR